MVFENKKEWIDERLSWNTSSLDRIRKIRMPCDRIWVNELIFL